MQVSQNGQQPHYSLHPVFETMATIHTFMFPLSFFMIITNLHNVNTKQFMFYQYFIKSTNMLCEIKWDFKIKQLVSILNDDPDFSAAYISSLHMSLDTMIDI